MYLLYQRKAIKLVDLRLIIRLTALQKDGLMMLELT